MSRNSPHREQFSLSSRLPDVSRIRTYYDETWLDYRMLWLNPQNRAIHFDTGISTPVATANPCST